MMAYVGDDDAILSPPNGNYSPVSPLITLRSGSSTVAWSHFSRATGVPFQCFLTNLNGILTACKLRSVGHRAEGFRRAVARE